MRVRHRKGLLIGVYHVFLAVVETIATATSLGALPAGKIYVSPHGCNICMSPESLTLLGLSSRHSQLVLYAVQS